MICLWSSVGLCCSSVSEMVCCWVLVLIYMYAALIHWWVEVLHADRTTAMCIWTTAEPRVRLLQRKNWFNPPPPHTHTLPPVILIYYYLPFLCDASIVVYSIYQCSSASVCLWLTVHFRIALRPSVRKELSPWLFTCAVFILVPS